MSATEFPEPSQDATSQGAVAVLAAPQWILGGVMMCATCSWLWN